MAVGRRYSGFSYGRSAAWSGLYLILVTSLCLAVCAPAALAAGQDSAWVMATDKAPFSDRLLESVVAYNDSLWVIGGMTGNYRFFSDVWRSDDGMTWEQVTPAAAFGERAVQGSVVFNNRMWVIAGREGKTLRFRNDVWSSADGITWTRVTEKAAFPPRTDFATVVFDNKIWVIGGNVNDGTPGNDVWYSSDGKTWHQATPRAQFSPRMNPSACVYNGKIWVTGGFDWKSVYNDVWSSDDGVTWTRETSHAPFAARRYQRMVTADNRMWVVGGYDGNNPLNDIWSSTDGKTWTLHGTTASYPATWGFDSVAFRDRIWVVGAGSGNDVWYFPISNTGAGSGSPDDGSCDPGACLVIGKEIAPVSIKMGTPAKVTLRIFNNGSLPVHDIQVLDTTLPEFPVSDGTTTISFGNLEANESRSVTYTVAAEKPGRYSLPKTSAMFAGSDGNYHIVYSHSPGVTVLAPLIPDRNEDGDLLDTLFSWFGNLHF